MVRVALLIFTLLSMFLLNACGNNNLKNPANMDDQDAVLFKKGKVSGRADRAIEREYNDNDQLVEKKEDAIFEDVSVEADFDLNTVIVKAKIINAKNEVEEVVYHGSFGENRIAIVRPTNPDLKTAASVRCKDKCDKLIVDIGILRAVGGKEEYEDQQFRVDNPSITVPKEEEVKEVPLPAVASVTGAPAKKEDLTTLPAVTVKPEGTTSAKSGAANPVSTKPNPSSSSKTPVAVAVKPEVIEVADPGVSSNKSPVLISESIVRGSNTLDLGESAYPIDLGEKYPGKAIDLYYNGSLVKGVDVATNATEKPSLFGFLSVDRKDKIYYGSGLLVKFIEDVSRAYTQMFPGNKFEVNDLSKKDGGKLTRRRDGVSHGSHQNGLDVDILLPKKGRSFDYEKIWSLIKTSHKTGLVDVIFLNSVRIKEICKYAKSKNEHETHKSAFGLLYRESGHLTHLHTRLKCTAHNPSCEKATYTKSKYGVCK